MGFGQSLKLEREQRGVSLEEVAAATRVSRRHLEALERDDFAELPGGVFNRGIVQSYCRTLGLEEAGWLARYATVEHVPADQDFSEFAEAVKRSRGVTPTGNSGRWWGVLAMFLLLALLVWASWRFYIRQRLGHPGPALPPAARLHLPLRSVHLPDRFFTA